MDIANNKINWLNIITNYLSSVSKLFREKLKPLLFKSLVLGPSRVFKFNIKKNIFREYFNYDQYGGSGYTVSSKVKGLSIERGFECLDKDFNSFKQLIKRLHIVNVDRDGYYFLSLLNNFCNLTELNLYSCFISYNGFFKLGEFSPNLKQIELRLVVLIKLATDRIPIGDVVLPPNLSYLRILKCGIIEIISIRDLYKFLLEHIYQRSKRNFVLPKITVPSLKSLVYIDNNIQDSELKDFLELNPNLESLKLKSFDYILDDSCSSIKRLEINNLSSFNTYSNTSALSSITILKIANVYMDHFDNISNLKAFCNKFPNLEELDLKPNYYKSFQVLADKFLTQFIYNLPKLKTLKLDILQAILMMVF
ncbi:hypothetical protein CONCODRAFT_74256 [Conidiobolus coronatus NRRL 28638]|uniref:RNI-like protein n=1 Tax=Conidiobolus coronatus (strain ATCC 28846 / CBS 209.66 / NRRL 28638) TaxID=796925 RepID=A0A137NS27_CONC2|nr:hypothetical protein CONCODRAFT_74256 [Conidiobolus coronatus NRRL 28638]|eukprot:KXN65490.1 hypothetical protein CONCODRAFT_74256 [Conidiobolus coronatus NRRL 28638]